MIYHAALPADWAAAQHSGMYTISTRDRSLADEGFIHASYEHQVDGVVNRYYADVDELVILIIDEHLVGSPVIDESPTADPADEHFPHVYGPIPIGAVVEARTWKRNPDQTGRV